MRFVIAILGALVACGSSGNATSDAGADAIVDTGPLPPDPCIDAGTCPFGVWVNVPPSTMSASVLSPTANAFGPGAIVADPSHVSDLYIGAGNDGVWKSTDYGTTWTRITTTIPGSPIGGPI